MPQITVDAFDWDSENEDKIAAHGLRPWDVDEVLDDRYVVDANRAGQRAPYLLIGQMENGQCVAVPIEPTQEPHVWRPVTAWRCKPAEAARLRQDRRRR